jgi:hypothetical protein
MGREKKGASVVRVSRVGVACVVGEQTRMFAGAFSVIVFQDEPAAIPDTSAGPRHGLNRKCSQPQEHSAVRYIAGGQIHSRLGLGCRHKFSRRIRFKNTPSRALPRRDGGHIYG